MGEIKRIDKLIEMLETEPRIGAETDKPEGVRYIQISDTLANILTKELRQCLKLGPPHNKVV
jgi:uncharacterized protein with von Willebrand factor type A (vWA) domain